MRKYIITFCLMLLCLIMFGSHAYAVFITDITEFVQERFVGGTTNTFTDSFDGGAGTEPPVGPSGPSTYVVEGTFASNRESGGSLELNSDDGIVVGVDEKILVAAVKDKTYFFSAGSGGHVIGTFDFSGGGLPPDSFFGIAIFNYDSVGGEISDDPGTDDEAWMGVYLDSGHLFGVWGDEESQLDPLLVLDPLGVQDLGLVSALGTSIELKLEIGTSNLVTASFDYGPSFFSVSDFSQLSFISGDVYTGGFVAGENIVPEPATVALLGIGLAGLAGAAVRRRLKKAKQQ